MAKLNEEKITIKISEMLKDDQPTNIMLDTDTVEQLIAVLQELVGERRLVELIKE